MNKPQPIPPGNVRVVLADGTSVPVECVYVGRKVCGCAQWVAVYPVDIGEAPGPDSTVRLKIDFLPARTEVAISVMGRIQS